MAARLTEWRIPAALVLLSLVPALAGTSRLVELANGAPISASNARFVASPWPVVLHILAVIPFTMVGAFQFAPAFRKRRRNWHRAAGRVLVVLGLVAALTGLWMAQFYPWPAGDGIGVYLERLLFGSGMVVSIGLGVAAILRHDYVGHGAWMMRAYAIGLGAGTQVLTHVPWFILVGKPGEHARTVLMGAGWVVNLVVAEWIIRKNSAAGCGLVPPSRPGVSIGGSGLSGPGPGARGLAEHESSGELLRQRGGGKFLRDAEDRVGRYFQLGRRAGGPAGPIRLHRGVVQSATAALDARLSSPAAYEETLVRQARAA